MTEAPENREKKREVPAWLLGLLVAAVIFLVVLLVFQALGFGDNPVLDTAAPLVRSW